ncbi:MAG: CDGSH iron-sulfur domain-containing protein [Myxococcota bacterium]
MIKLKVLDNGPYLLSGVETITRLSDGTTFEISGNAALCRCGGSKNKPFCDGTHKTNGFSGDKDPNRVPDRAEHYAAAGITIRDNRGLCAHAGRCTDGSPDVFRLKKEPFVDPEAAPPEQIASTIRQCPSGALSYSIAGTDYTVRGGDALVGFVPGGPYVVKGGADLEGAALLEGGTTDHFALCRCGKSTNKPFCSGAHWNVEFDEDAKRS